MRVLEGDFRSWGEVAPGGSAVTIGVFDGVHRGHHQLLVELRRRAEELGGLERVVLTFDHHPLELVAPERAPLLLTTLERRIRLLDGLADVVAVLTFEKVRDLEAEAFIAEVLADTLHARLVAVGADFRFGRDRRGDLALLRRLGPAHGFEVDEVRLVGEEGVPVSSTRIRELVTTGLIQAANRELGHRFEVRGEVVPGEGRGRQIGVPTANLAMPAGIILPADGVYAAWAVLPSGRYPAVVNVGVRPTFGGRERVIEAHLLDFDGNLYGTDLGLELVERIRSERKFEGIEQLAAQIRRDIAAARARLTA